MLLIHMNRNILIKDNPKDIKDPVKNMGSLVEFKSTSLLQIGC